MYVVIDGKKPDISYHNGVCKIPRYHDEGLLFRVQVINLKFSSFFLPVENEAILESEKYDEIFGYLGNSVI